MKPTSETVLAYILKRHRSILSLSQRFSNEKKLRSILKELRLEGKIRYGRLSHKNRGMYLHCYVPEMPPEGVQIVGMMEEKQPLAREKVIDILIEWENALFKSAKQADMATDVCNKIFQAMEASADD